MQTQRNYKQYKGQTKPIRCHLCVQWGHTRAQCLEAKCGEFICEECGPIDHEWANYPNNAHWTTNLVSVLHDHEETVNLQTRSGPKVDVIDKGDFSNPQKEKIRFQEATQSIKDTIRNIENASKLQKLKEVLPTTMGPQVYQQKLLAVIRTTTKP